MTRIVTKQADNPGMYSADRFVYAQNGQAVTYLLKETWAVDPTSSCTLDYNIVTAREFRYDASRERYLDRQLDHIRLMDNPPTYETLTETWSDYDNDVLYGDWTTDGQSVTDARSYTPGMATTLDPSGTATTDYYHTDLIGTTRSMSDASGVAQEPAVYTAFGEPISGLNPRLGYAGAWGYQSNGGSPYLHLGARYYDSATGRFLQRDPIGVRGGFNVYAYVRNQPMNRIDPTGLIGAGNGGDGHYYTGGGVDGAYAFGKELGDNFTTHQKKKALGFVLSCGVGQWAGGIRWAIATGATYLISLFL